MDQVNREATTRTAPFGLDASVFDPAISRGWLAALPDFAIGMTFLVAWLSPASLPAQTIPHLLLILLLEFIIIHSSAFLGTVAFAPTTRRAKVTLMLGLGGFYTLFVGSFSIAFHTAWPLLSFWGLMLNRLLGVVIGQVPSAEQKAFIRRTWAATAIFYLAGCGLTVVAPIPALGLTPDVLASLHGSGLWFAQPQRAMAFGFLYFTAVACSEIGGHAWAGERSPAPRPA